MLQVYHHFRLSRSGLLLTMKNATRRGTQSDPLYAKNSNKDNKDNKIIQAWEQ